ADVTFPRAVAAVETLRLRPQRGRSRAPSAPLTWPSADIFPTERRERARERAFSATELAMFPDRLNPSILEISDQGDGACHGKTIREAIGRFMRSGSLVPDMASGHHDDAGACAPCAA